MKSELVRRILKEPLFSPKITLLEYLNQMTFELQSNQSSSDHYNLQGIFLEKEKYIPTVISLIPLYFGSKSIKEAEIYFPDAKVLALEMETKTYHAKHFRNDMVNMAKISTPWPEDIPHMMRRIYQLATQNYFLAQKVFQWPKGMREPNISRTQYWDKLICLSEKIGYDPTKDLKEAKMNYFYQWQ